jgi:hypothetical protein
VIDVHANATSVEPKVAAAGNDPVRQVHHQSNRQSAGVRHTEWIGGVSPAGFTIAVKAQVEAGDVRADLLRTGRWNERNRNPQQAQAMKSTLQDAPALTPHPPPCLSQRRGNVASKNGAHPRASVTLPHTAKSIERATAPDSVVPPHASIKPARDSQLRELQNPQ